MIGQEKKTKLRADLHSVYNLTYHLVLVTKHRRKCLKIEHQDFLESHCGRIIAQWDCEMLEFGAEEDHIHILFSAHPAMQISVLINNLKTVTARLIRKEYAKYLEHYYWKPVFWTRGYCLITAGGVNLEVLTKYIQNQGSQI